MNQRSPVLKIEFTMVDRESIDPNQIQPLNIYQDLEGHYFSGKAIKQIKKAIVKIVLRLGSNFRHPLYFDVQIFPQGQTNLVDILFDRSSSSTRYRRVGKSQ